MIKKNEWKIVGHNYQIADTGDYDGCFELTNGKMSIYTQDGDEESLQIVVDTLNDSECEFYLDDSNEFELHVIREENKILHEFLDNPEKYEEWKKSVENGDEVLALFN